MLTEATVEGWTQLQCLLPQALVGGRSQCLDMCTSSQALRECSDDIAAGFPGVSDQG